MELTVPFDSEKRAQNAEVRKKERYGELLEELKESHNANLITIEAGARWYITKDNKQILPGGQG